MNTARRTLRVFETAGPLVALVGVLVINYFAGHYVSARGALSASLDHDLMHSLLPRIDLTVVFVWGFAAFLFFTFWATLAFERERAGYILWMFSLLIAVRAFFMILTPMGAPLGEFRPDDSAVFQLVGRYLTFHNDYFFSAHTSLPFLGFLLYKRPAVRAVFLAFSVVLAATVLLSRMHYSIDVAGAYLITAGLVASHRVMIEPAYDRMRKRWFGGGSPKSIAIPAAVRA